MRINFKRFFSSLLVLAVLAGLLGLTALAGSDSFSFSFAFSDEGQSDKAVGYKSDAGESSGNYATVAARTCWAVNGTPVLQVKTDNGVAVTAAFSITSTGTYNMGYQVSVTNGTIYLHGRSTGGACGVTGDWWP